MCMAEWQGMEASVGERVTGHGTRLGQRRLRTDGGLEINIVYFANVAGAVLRPHKIAY